MQDRKDWAQDGGETRRAEDRGRPPDSDIAGQRVLAFQPFLHPLPVDHIADMA
jgi:hypothetical protein